MQFDSLADALHMGGHGVYVWIVVVVSVLVIGGLLLIPALSNRRFLAEQQGSPESDSRSAPSVRIEEVNNASGS